MNDAEPELTSEQARVLQLLQDRHNVFLTGGGGVGKSFLIHTAVQHARAAGRRVAITASTGAAADVIGGTTLHALLGLGLAKDPVDKLVVAALRSHKIATKWQRLDVLIVDEVSMIDPAFFTAVDKVARAVRKQPDAPFGGLQLLLCGDFFQLPPVMPKTRDSALFSFCFQTDSWQSAQLHIVELTHIFRQVTDPMFTHLLQRARTGDYTVDDVDMLMQRVNVELVDFASIEPTRLFARRVNVDDMNHSNLAKLNTQQETYNAHVRWTLDADVNPARRDEMTKLLKHAAANVDTHAAVKSEVTLKVGAQVMLLCNLNLQEGLVNGSRGVLTGFVQQGGEQLPVVQFAKGRELTIDKFCWEIKVEDAGTIFYRQVPLQLAWAVTIHKAQGLSLDCVELQLDRSVFEYGQAYVALSRVRSLAGLRLTAFTRSTLMAHPLVKQFYASLATASAPAPPMLSPPLVSLAAAAKSAGGNAGSSLSSVPPTRSWAEASAGQVVKLDAARAAKKPRVELF